MKAINILFLFLFVTCSSGPVKKSESNPMDPLVDQFVVCFRNSRSHNSLKSIKFTTQFTIQKNGKIRDPKVIEKLNDPEFENCILTKISEIEFSPIDQETIMTLPVSLNTEVIY